MFHKKTQFQSKTKSVGKKFVFAAKHSSVQFEKDHL